MMSAFILTLIVLGIFKWKNISITQFLMSSMISAICYIGIFALIATTFTQSLKNQSHH